MGFADTMKPDLLNENKPISPRKGEIGLTLQTYNKLGPDFGNGRKTSGGRLLCADRSGAETEG